MGSRPRTASIHVPDDDSLLHTFYLYRPFLLGEDEDELSNARLWGGERGWVRGRTFVEDGETSFSVQHPTWIFLLSLVARPSRTC